MGGSSNTSPAELTKSFLSSERYEQDNVKEYVIRIHAAEIETNSVINEIETNSVINADERKGGGGGQIQVRRARNNLSKNVSFVNIKMDRLKYNIEPQH